MVDRCTDAQVELVFVKKCDRVVSGAIYVWPSGQRRRIWWREAGPEECETLTLEQVRQAIAAGDVRPA